MKSLIITWIFNFFFWITIFNTKFVSSFDEFWHEMQPATQQLINSYITMCEKKGIYFDNAEGEDEVKECVSSNLEKIMRPIFSNSGENPRKIALAISDLKMAHTLSSEQVVLLGKNLVEPACQLLPAMLICSKSYQYRLIKSCSANPDVERIILDYIETVIRASCKYNGDRIVELLAANGINCFSLLSDGLHCFQNVSTHAEMLTPQDLCKLFGIAHECLVRRFESCGGKPFLRILNLILDDVKTWVSSMCANLKTSTENDALSNNSIKLTIYYFNYYFSIIFFVYLF